MEPYVVWFAGTLSIQELAASIFFGGLFSRVSPSGTMISGLYGVIARGIAAVFLYGGGVLAGVCEGRPCTCRFLAPEFVWEFCHTEFPVAQWPRLTESDSLFCFVARYPSSARLPFFWGGFPC